MTGIVTAGLQAKLHLEVLGSSGGWQVVEAVIDTGFDGELSLPGALIAALGLASVGTYYANLADGKRAVLNYYQANIIWHGRPRLVEVLESG
jgi:clan AA aspartic protease